MKIIFGLCIFCVVLFIYLHVQFHLKTAEDLEMYEVDQPSKDRLEEVCDLRQPVLFDFDCDKIMDTTNRAYIATHYNAFEMKIRNVHEMNEHADLYVPLPVHASIKLFDEDKTASFFTENNSDFLDETGVGKNMRYNDEFLRPYMVSNCNYDCMMGSAQACSPFRYEVNYRNYFLLTQGKAQVKLAPPHSTRYLSPIYDYENFEFRSPINPWNPQPKYSADFDKVKCLEFTLMPGKTLYIPAYWWYSIQFQKETSIACFRYRTYMNNLAISPYIAMYALQIQNVKRDTMKKVSIQELNYASKVVSSNAVSSNEVTSNADSSNEVTLNQVVPEHHPEVLSHDLSQNLSQPMEYSSQ